MRFIPIVKPIAVVVLPSPGGVGVMEVTTIYLPLGLSTKRVNRSGDNLARYLPCGSISSRDKPICSAIRAIGRGDWRLDIRYGLDPRLRLCKNRLTAFCHVF